MSIKHMIPEFFLFTTIFLFSCKKLAEKSCWQIVDNLGNELMIVCDKTESQLIDCLKKGTCWSIPGDPNCRYYKTGGDKFCWLLNGRFIKDATENKMKYLQRCFGGGTLQKVDCNYCSDWYWREKRTYKPTNNTFFTSVTKQQFCGDTARTLFNGRQIIRKDDADSLIVVQFSNNGVF